MAHLHAFQSYTQPPPATPREASPEEEDAGPWSLTSPGCHVSLTHAALSPSAALDLVRSPKAGALVLFAGTTRDNFNGRAVKELKYSAYVPRALRTMLDVAEGVKARHGPRMHSHDEEAEKAQGASCCPAPATNPGVLAVAIVHRLGVVPVGEESVLIAIASAHRKEAWVAGEEALEEVKAKVEVWKLEEFHGGEGVWRANRDGAEGVRVERGQED